MSPGQLQPQPVGDVMQSMPSKTSTRAPPPSTYLHYTGSLSHDVYRSLPNLYRCPTRPLRLRRLILSWPPWSIATLALRLTVVISYYHTEQSGSSPSFRGLSPYDSAATPAHNRGLAVRFIYRQRPAVLPAVLDVPPKTIDSIGIPTLPQDILCVPPHAFHSFVILPCQLILGTPLKSGHSSLLASRCNVRPWRLATIFHLAPAQLYSAQFRLWLFYLTLGVLVAPERNLPCEATVCSQPRCLLIPYFLPSIYNCHRQIYTNQVFFPLALSVRSTARRWTRLQARYRDDHYVLLQSEQDACLKYTLRTHLFSDAAFLSTVYSFFVHAFAHHFSTPSCNTIAHLSHQLKFS